MRRTLLSAALGALLGAAAVAFLLIYEPWAQDWRSWAQPGGAPPPSPPAADRARDVRDATGATDVREVTDESDLSGFEVKLPLGDGLRLTAEPLIEVDRFAEAPASPESGGADPLPEGEKQNPPAEEVREEAGSATAERRPVDYREMGDRIFEVAEALDRFKEKLRQSAEREKPGDGEPPADELPEVAAEASGEEE